MPSSASSASSAAHCRRLQYRLLLLKNGSSNSGGALSRIRPGFFDPTSRCLRDGLDSGGRCGGGGVGDGGGDGVDYQLKRKMIHGEEFSFAHTMFVVVALLLFSVYFIGFIDRMRTAMSNVTTSGGGGGGGNVH
jgi:hypothetical protein